MGLDILFLGRLFPREKEVEIKAKMKTGMQDAANALQWNIIEGLDANECGKIKIINYLPVDSYPRGYTDKRIPGFSFQHTNQYDANDINISCTNMTIVKQFCNIYAFQPEIKKWAKNKDESPKILMCYTAHSMFLKLAKYAKKINPSIITCCIIADIPEFASVSDLHGIRNIYRNYCVKKCASLYRYIDKFVLLTEQMATKLDIKAPFAVMEGIAPDVNSEVDNKIAIKFANQKYIFYSGTLNYKFGIQTLLDAFAKIQDSTLKLVICGFGEAEKSITESTDNRIVYLGKIDRKQVLALQRQATVLVNPRQNNEDFTKYSFPSKTMEYLASGVPLVAYKLDGIPDEYDDYINYVPDNSPEALAKEILRVLGMSAEERAKSGAEAQRFVLENKNNVIQAEKIVKMLNTLK